MMENDSSAPAGGKAAGRRLMSIDALRGFDMFWIAGGEVIVHALKRITDVPFVHFLSAQLRHSPWKGFTFYDLIFPLFLFIMGVSLVFSLRRLLATQGKRAAIRRILVRSAWLFLLGMFHGGGIAEGWSEIDLTSVLQRIAYCYLFAALLFCTLRPRGLLVVCVALLAGYWALLTFVPVPDVGAGHLEKGINLSDYLDIRFLPDHRRHNEGMLSTLPGVAACLFGVFAGLLLKNTSVSEQKKVGWLALGGLAGVLLGFLWGVRFPVIKRIWTSSYVLVAAGYSSLLLAAFYQVIEIWKFRRWALLFVWFGMNSITIYMAENVVDAWSLAERLVGGPIQAALGVYADLAGAVVIVLASTLFVRFLYNRKIFLRL